jgi:hypothetical protein
MALALAPQWPRAGFSPALPVILLIAGLASAHDHHGGESKIPEGHTVSEEPIDTTLWIHILIQMLAYGVIFPIGMVLGVPYSV